MPSLGQTIPALPVRDVPRAANFFCDVLGFELLHGEDGFAVLERDEARIHLWRAADEAWKGRTDPEANPVRSGAESFLAGTASCRIETDGVDDLYLELSRDSHRHLHPRSRAAVSETGFGTREFAVLDLDGNLIEFFCWV